MCNDMKVPFLGRIPLDPRIGWQTTDPVLFQDITRLSSIVSCSGKACDEGKSFFDEVPDSVATQAFKNIIQCKHLASKQSSCVLQERVVDASHYGLVYFAAIQTSCKSSSAEVDMETGEAQ